MNSFNNLKLKWKLIAIVLIPILSLLYFAQAEVRKNYAIKTENNKILVLSKLAVKASNLVHELQKERGLSSAYQGSDGTEFSTELTAQRKQVDEKAKQLKTVLADFDVEEFGSDFVTQLQLALDMHNEIGNKRQTVTSLSISKEDALAYYTNMNSAFLGMIGFLPTLSTVGELSSMGGAYVNFLNSKDRAGQERSVLAIAFSQDVFDSGLYERFNALVTTQSVYLNVFTSLATREQIQFYNETMKGEFIEETENMRAIATERANLGGFNIDPGYWFDMQTGKINLLKTVEDKLSDDLFSLANRLQQEASSALMFSIITTLVSLLFTAGFVFFMQRKLASNVNHAVKIASNIAEGNFNNDINSDATDEIGEMLTALQYMQTELFGQINREKEEALRIQEALNNTTTNVIVADTEHNIMYMNDTAVNMFNDNKTEFNNALPDLNLNELNGTGIFSFHKDASKRRMVLQELNATNTTEIQLGQHIFNVVANPVLNEKGERLGTVEEWTDLTQQKVAEQQIEQVISAAVAGELSTRLDSNRFEGFMKTMAEGVNQMLDTIVEPLKVAADYVDRIAKGDIPEPITADYQGDFSLIKNNLNTCIKAINQLVNDAESLSVAAVQGKLETRADVDCHQGDFRKIIEGVNNTLDAIVMPINECKVTMDALSKGNLTKTMQGNFQGEFAVLKDAINTSIKNLYEMVNKIRNSADRINNASDEISTASIDLSQRTEEQASSLEETASSLEELTSTVEQNRDNTNSANDLAIATAKRAEQGGEVVSEAVTAMETINASSKEIVDIIGVIDDIAFQTNLLALNASVEAARAGEQGRGFAVVASEVRNLAQRSAEAAKDIKELINDSVGKVEHGSELVNKSGTTLEEIIAEVKKVNSIIAEIAEASEEQFAGINQVNVAINQMDQMTQQNAAMVEETSASSKSMDDEAKDLIRLMEAFNVGSTTQQSKLEADNSLSTNNDIEPKPDLKVVGGNDEWQNF